MYLSQYFIPKINHISNDIKLISHRLSIQAGLIHQLASGIYTILPLGYRVFKKIEQIIAEEMEKIGAHMLIMPTIQPAEIWKESGRYDIYGKEMLRMKDRHNRDFLFGPTHEEIATNIFRNSVQSYKDLPLHLMQIQWKFRDEIRPRHGIMRSREFLMKDSYSFDLDPASAKLTYTNVFKAYLKIFKKIGIKVIPTRANSGAIGGNLSHEMQVISEYGENKIFCDKTIDQILEGTELSDYEQHYIASDDYHQDDGKKYFRYNGFEVGHLFNFKTKYSKIMKASVTNKDGKIIYPDMGSYGIGVSRLLGAIIESSHDEHGIIWPHNIAPFKVIIINLKNDNEKCKKISEELYEELKKRNIEVLMSDEKESMKNKINQVRIYGIPYLIIIGKNFLERKKIEIEERKTMKKIEMISIKEIIKLIIEKLS